MVNLTVIPEIQSSYQPMEREREKRETEQKARRGKKRCLTLYLITFSGSFWGFCCSFTASFLFFFLWKRRALVFTDGNVFVWCKKQKK